MNNKRLSRTISALASITLLLIAFAGVSTAAGLGNNREFAMKMNMAGNDGQMQGREIVMTFYVGKNRFRAEMAAGAMEGMPGGIAFINIFDGDEVTSYTLMSMQKQYMKNVATIDDYMEDSPMLIFGSPDDPEHPCQSSPDMSCEKIGTETFLGRAVDKYLVKEIEDGVPVERTMWFDPGLLLPLKVESDDGMMEATSIKIGTQPDELFDIPAGYSEMQMGMPMPR